MKTLMCPCGLNVTAGVERDLADMLMDKYEHDKICKKGPCILMVE